MLISVSKQCYRNSKKESVYLNSTKQPKRRNLELKKKLVIEDIMFTFISCIGYSVGYIIPKSYGMNDFISMVICFALGMAIDSFVNKILYSRFLQENNRNKYIAFAGMLLIYMIALCLVEFFFSHSLLADLRDYLAYIIAIPVISFCVTYCIKVYKRKKIVKKYGNGDSGFIIDKKATDKLKNMTDENKFYSNYDGKNPVVTVGTGSYIGKKDKKGVSFLGIPYAKAERWKKAVQLETSTEYYEAYYFGNSEVQPDSSHNILSEVPQDENCLNLNIWTSKLEPKAQKPVFVYFHGGDGRYGGTANPLYHLENIAKAIPDAVFVSVNYRFGVFGVIDFSATNLEGIDAYKDTTALSLLDQVEALKWIRDNISAFGGDPENITVAGDSAGGSDICLLSVMKEAKGLFKRAFIMCASTIDTPDRNDKASLLGEKLIEEFDVKNVSDLENITPKQLRDFSTKYYDLIELSPRNGLYVTKDVEKAYLDGAAADIEFIFGVAADDVSAWEGMLADEIAFDEIVKEYFEFFTREMGPANEDKINALIRNYKQTGLSDSEAKKEMLADFQYKASILHDCSLLAKGGSKVRCFYWDVKSDVEKLTANAVSMVTAILGNMNVAEQMGYIHEKSITEIINALINKYIHGDKVALYNNEIKGVKKLDWDEFDAEKWSVLHIKRGTAKMSDTVFSENIKQLEKLI